MNLGVAACLVLALGGIGAARVPTSEPEALCIPLVMNCSTPTPTPTDPSNPTDPTDPSGGLGGLLGNSAPGGVPVIPVVAPLDPDAPTMTLPAAQLGGSSLSFTGLQAPTLVAVRLANGDETTVIRLAADTITITDFSLDVRPAGNVPGLVSNASRMELSGNVVVYVNSVSATLLGGTGLTLGADTPLPSNETIPSTLLNVNLGLVGVTANTIHFTASHQFFE